MYYRRYRSGSDADISSDIIKPLQFHPHTGWNCNGLIFPEEWYQTVFLQFGYHFRGKCTGVQGRRASLLVNVFLQGRLVYYTFCDRWRGKRGYRYADCGECLWAKIVIIITIFILCSEGVFME